MGVRGGFPVTRVRVALGVLLGIAFVLWASYTCEFLLESFGVTGLGFYVGLVVSYVTGWLAVRVLFPPLRTRQLDHIRPDIYKATTHYDTTTKSCFDFGCTDDCPVAVAHRNKMEH